MKVFGFSGIKSPVRTCLSVSTILSLESKQPCAFTWGGSGENPLRQVVERKNIFGLSIMRHSIILIS